MMVRLFLSCFGLALLSGAVFAVPSIEIVDFQDGSGVLNITTDEPGALAAELTLETFGGLNLTGATINTALFDDPNPGDSPFIPGSPVGGDAEGLVFEPEANRLFAAFGSGDLGVGTHEFLSFTYAGFPPSCSCGGNCNFDAGGNVAQGGNNNAVSGLGGPIGDCPSPDDFNGDGVVGDADLTLLLRDWAKAVPPAPSGWVNGATAPAIGDDELTALLSTWGQGTATAVPEPASATMLALAALATLGSRRLR